ncbi:T-cell surface antigen CD2 [Sphaerodactylus townsendi]|uniref:T-cell surface antigen CD2 n=1 Tax=Sphaerodactylus townsendi TaxID=933632 RepID=UPI00202631AF|nr:T-cell surface antigen CD2 [Sphaerodactylus townsendi]
MKMDIILLIKSLLTIVFCLKGAVADPRKVYGVLNHSVNLFTSFSQDTSHKLEWIWDSKPQLWWKSSGTNVTEKERHYLFPNGTLKIERLLESDTGNYTVKRYSKSGSLGSSSTITLHVVEPLPPLTLVYNCSNKILSCEVKYNAEPKPSFKLFQDKKEQKILELKHVNAEWKGVTRSLPANQSAAGCARSTGSPFFLFRASGGYIETCQCGETYIFLIMYIGAGIIVFVIFVALLVCCIRKKKAERCEPQAEERELRPTTEAMKYRRLPQPPGHDVLSQPRPQQRQPPPCPAVQQQLEPPLPRPRPQQKPPRRMKDKLHHDA